MILYNIIYIYVVNVRGYAPKTWFYMMHSCGALPLKNGYRWSYIGLSFHNWGDS